MRNLEYVEGIMNVVFLCNTYYQAIVAIQLRLTEFKNDTVYLVMSDHSKGTKEFTRRLKVQNVFTDVYFIKTLKSDRKVFVKKSRFVLLLAAMGHSVFLYKTRKLKADCLIYYNTTFSTQCLFSQLYNKNDKIKCSRMEEGLLSYQYHFHDKKFFLGKKKTCYIYNFREKFHKKNLYDCVDGFYCFRPEVYDGVLNPIKIDTIDFYSGIKNILVGAFDINLTDDDYKEKFIFFTSVYDFEGGEPIGEYELVCKVADLVGKDNLLVKTHPRDVRTIYEDNGFKVDKNSDIPWEAIQLSRDFSDKVFLTVNSSSVLAGSFMSENAVKTFYLNKLCKTNGNDLAKKGFETLEKLLSNEELKNSLAIVSVVQKLEDILL